MQDFFSLKFGPNKKKLCLARIKLQLDPVVQADILIKHCCNFARDSQELETDGDMYI